MKEHGIDISGQKSKSMSPYLGQSFDYVITVCDDAYQECPVFPGAGRQLHWSTPDPSFEPGGLEKQREAFRKTRASLEGRIKDLLALIRKEKAAH
jgi:arsenate reductase